MLIVPDGVSIPIAFQDCDALFPVFAAVLGNWPLCRIDDGAPPDPGRVISVRRHRRGFRITSPWLDAPLTERSAVGAVFSVTAELARAYAEETPGRLCLHCAAVEVDGNVLIFPSTEQAGKSTLAVQLASCGFRLFADDVLPICETALQAMSLGIAPRLRLPLPPTAGAAFRDFVDEHAGPHDHEFAYLALPPALLAPYGARAAIGNFVLLDRQVSASPRLTPVPGASGLHQLIVQNFASDGTAIRTVDRLHGLLRRAPCFSLTYSDLGEAAAFLRDRFAAPSCPAAGGERRPPDTEISVDVRPARSGARARHFVQAPGVVLRTVDDDLFLVRDGEHGVFHLNAVAAGLWRLLEQPTTLATATQVVCAAFPQADRRRIRRDVRTLFRTLQSGGLIRPSNG